MSKGDPYTILGVERNASAAQIKSAFRTMAKDLHPDKNPNDDQAERKFKEVNEAYEILKDPKRREAFDTHGHMEGHGGGDPFGQGFGSSMSDIFDNLFRDQMGGARQRGGRGHAGSNLRYEMEVTLQDVLNGKKEVIHISSRTKCEPCSGSGAKKGTRPVMCDHCQGAGVVRSTQGFFTMERTCSRCQGIGEMITDPCTSCGGTGRVMRQRKLEINIPKGVESDTRLRVSGEGEAGLHGGPPGDLYVFFTVRDHPVFKRKGSDLICQVPIPMTKATLGGPVEVCDLEGGKLEVQVPAGTQNGTKQRLRGKGLPSLRSPARGDIYLVLQVEIPVKLSSRQRELMEEFAAETGSHNQPESEGFLGKLKDFIDRFRD